MKRWNVATTEGATRPLECHADECEVTASGALRFFNSQPSGSTYTVQIVAPSLWADCVVYLDDEEVA